MHQWRVCTDVRGRVRPKRRSRSVLGSHFEVLSGEPPLTLAIEPSLEEEEGEGDDGESCYSSDDTTGDGCWRKGGVSLGMRESRESNSRPTGVLEPVVAVDEGLWSIWRSDTGA